MRFSHAEEPDGVARLELGARALHHRGAGGGAASGCAGAWKPLAVARTVRGVPSAAELLFLAFLSMSASSVQPPQIERTAPRKRAMKECLLIYLMIVRL